MQFSELLDRILNDHHIRSSEICNALGLKKSYFSRIRNGTLIPPTFDLVDDISALIHLTSEEYRDLAYAYQELKAEGRYQTACDAFRRLYSFQPKPLPQGNNESNSPLPNGAPLQSRAELLDTLSCMIQNGDICAWFCPEDAPFSEELSLLFRNHQRHIQWLLPLDDSSNCSVKNTELFANALPLLCCGEETHCIRSKLETVLGSSVFPYYFLSNDAVLLVNRALTAGLYLNTPETVTLYRDQFAQSFANAALFVDVRTDLMSFFGSRGAQMAVSESDEDTEFYVIERNPCILLNMKSSDFSQYIADIPGAKELAAQYFTFLQGIFNNVKQSYSLFSMDGLKELIHAEEYYEMNQYLTKSIPVGFRRTALNAVASYSSGESNYASMLIRLPLFDKTCVRALNIWSDGRMIALFTFAEGFHVLSMHDRTITSEMIGYYKALMKCGLIRSKEETLEILEQELYKAELNESNQILNGGNV